MPKEPIASRKGIKSKKKTPLRDFWQSGFRGCVVDRKNTSVANFSEN